MGILSSSFVDAYKTRSVKWGFPSGPNYLGELVYRRTYSRDGESWYETVARVVEGTYEILESYCQDHGLPFSHTTARRDAEEMYERIFSFKFTPPGRGLWMMGTSYPTTRTGAALNNCGFVSTKDIATDLDKPFRFLMDMSMLGVGTGFDTRGAGKIRWQLNKSSYEPRLIPDTREGWVQALGSLLRWGFGAGHRPVFDYSLIRRAGLPIRGFGGISSGPEPLQTLLSTLEELIRRWNNTILTSRHIVDIMNLIGVCVVAGNVRRTAEIALGDPEDDDFLNLKDYARNPDRAAYGWSSNNSVFATVGMDYKTIAERNVLNGEPGLVWLDLMSAQGRLCDPPDHRDYRILGLNPCGEQALESYELCCLVETYPNHHTDLDDYRRTLKYAYKYAKAVTLVPTHWKETNAVLMRNRRIGTSMSGVVQFVAHRGEQELIDWCEAGYATIGHYDRVYSEWLCVRESIRKTSIKPSGTVSLLAGASPGVHWPVYRHYIRRVRYSADHPDVQALQAAGYPVEYAVVGVRDGRTISDMRTVVVSFPVLGDDALLTEREVSVGQKMHLAALLQRYWADNQVSCTASFHPDTEGSLLADLLRAYEGKLKVISFLPLHEQGAYPQMPYEPITEETYHAMTRDLKPINWNGSVHSEDDRFCDGGSCQVIS